jgi:glycosyltransferase involved in cell wall biosynthesis
MRQPSVSVVMPVWNADAGLLDQAITSLLDQTLTDWELVMVEDPSPNMVTHTISQYDDDRIRYFANEGRTSLVAQLNRALHESRSQVVARMDADDICEPTRLEEQLAFLNAQPQCGVLGCQLSIIDEHGLPVGQRNYPCSHEEIRKTMSLRNAIAHPTVMFRLEPVLAVGGYRYDKYLGLEDYDLWCRLLKKGIQFRTHPHRLLRYRIHTGQIKQYRLREQILGTIEIKQLHLRGQMGGCARLRLCCEKVLLLIPAGIVMWLFRKCYIRRPSSWGIIHICRGHPQARTRPGSADARTGPGPGEF